MGRVTRLDHPLVAHHLCTVRDATTEPAAFRAATARLAILLGVGATETLALRDTVVQTPLAAAPSQCLAQRIALVPILRAGLGLVEPMLQLLPEAQVWHLGLYRNEETVEPVTYYEKLPETDAPDVALVLDPMLATGGSIMWVIRRLLAWGVSDIGVLSLIASQPGIDRVAQEFPSVNIFVCAVDPELNEEAFIVPGLGDAGDRSFDT